MQMLQVMLMVRNEAVRKPELLAPAGDWVSLRAAIDAGADAVYFGIKGINMRAGAQNFSLADMKKISKLCHDADVKCYLALNTIVYEHELTKIEKMLDRVKEVKVDAVIAWDLSVLSMAVKRSIDVHISTQMSVSNSRSLLFFYNNFGIKRFVLARECSIDDIKRINKQLDDWGIDDVEIEVFAHGAMCVAISGRCFMSQFQYGKSANRGECIQPCRREYEIADKEGTIGLTLGHDYVLSPKDLCTIPIIDKFIDAGASVFKIEGRNRSPEYVDSTVRSYREMIDWYMENKRKKTCRKDMAELKSRLIGELRKVYNRDFSTGFYMGKPIDEWCDDYGSKATETKQYVGYVVNHFKKPGVAEIKVESNTFSAGDELMVQGPTTGVKKQKVDSIEWQHTAVDAVEKGKNYAVKLGFIVRKNDKVYVLRKRK